MQLLIACVRVCVCVCVCVCVYVLVISALVKDTGGKWGSERESSC